jgi:hypothetical protein
MSAWKVRFPWSRAERAEGTGKHWYVNRNYAWLWPLVYSAVGMAILSAVLFWLGSTRK